jgi:hypothetical protein
MPDDDNVVALPYGGTRNPNSGFAGSETSRARAREADTSGLTGDRQRRAIIEITRSGARGLTWKELSDLTGWHHGNSSGVLSNLHKVGRIARLKEKRLRCKVYVLTDQAGDREVEAPGRTSTGNLLSSSMEFIESLDHRTLSVEQMTTRNRLLNRYARRSE